MKFGMHLPQAGPAATAPAIHAVARQAEELGFDDIWVSDHVAVPKDAVYPPSAYILDPLIALTWGAAATERVGLGADPQRHRVVRLPKHRLELNDFSEV